MLRNQSANLTEIFKNYRRRDSLDLYLNDGEALHLSRGAITRGNIEYKNWIRSIEEMRTSIDAGVDRVTVNCQNVDSLLGFNLASNLRLLDYATADVGKQYQSMTNPALVEDIPQLFRSVLANAEAGEKTISFEVIADYESLGSIIASRSLSPLSPWRSLNGIEVTQTPVVANPKTREDFIKNGVEWEFGGWEFFEEPSSNLPGAGGNDGGTGGGIDPCFTGETLVWTPDGEIPIGEIKERFERGNKSVYSFDPLTGRIIEDEIAEVFEHQVTGFFTFHLSHATTRVTKEHPFLIEFGQFRQADELTRGDSTKIFNRGWHYSVLEQIKWNSDETETVWNIHVAQNQTYFANRNAVHNLKDRSEFEVQYSRY